MKRKLILVALVLFVFMASCKKEEEPVQQKEELLTQIIIGEKPENAESLPFAPIVIGRVYGWGYGTTIEFSGLACFVISNTFSVSHGDNMEHSSKQIKTLNSCSFKTSESSLAVFRSGDVVDIDSTFSSGTFNIAGLDKDCYLVYKFETDKEYVGWIKIDHNGYDFNITDYCEYEIKY